MSTLDEDPQHFLECFKQTKHPLTVARLNQITGLSVEALRRLLLRLINDGWIYQTTILDHSGFIVVGYLLTSQSDDTSCPDEFAEQSPSSISSDPAESETALTPITRKSKRALSQTDLEDLIRKINEGDKKAQDDLILSALPWLSAMADSLCNEEDKHQDLVQLGAEAFLRSIRRFNVAVGTSIFAFSYRRVRGSMISYVAREGRGSQLSKKMRLFIRLSGQARERLHHRLEREPSIAEIAIESKLNEKDVRAAQQADLARSSTSLDGPMFNEDSPLPEDLLRASERFQPEQVVEASHLLKMLEHSADTKLDDIENEILFWRYFAPMPKLLRELASELGISKSQVHRIERSALRKLREGLDDYS